MHCLANSRRFVLLLSEIIRPVLALTTTHFSFSLRNRRIVDVGILALNFLAINRWISDAVSSTSCSSILSMYAAISLVMVDGRPDLRQSSRPSPFVYAKVRCHTSVTLYRCRPGPALLRWTRASCLAATAEWSFGGRTRSVVEAWFTNKKERETRLRNKITL